MLDSLLAKGEQLQKLIGKYRSAFGSVVRPALTKENTLELRLSNPNNILAAVDPTDAEGCWEAIERELKQTQKVAAVGGYAEKRTAYRINPELFGSDLEERCIHLGVDIWMAGGTAVYAPLDGTVHSFADNASLGNYGPTIILEHKLEDVVFYTLYGHLTRESLSGKYKGQTIKKGDAFAAIGWPHENGNWVVHLHYQFMADMLGNEGDFPGVSTEKEAELYLTLCPEPAVV
ncbi:MAG: peptidoglycan DD-metalloendopeptidase family protein [Flavobacteriales bacterium]|nr:peptidoglycan DD-metalloendopeptidase family protein [Flavobacteriales bacterium]MCB9187503.1 peptidoglycan DD-metalloendopeptidase family protein [Flavobacteriales bacterium]MCB9190672.1 peptidoglycan DD-metalloendopeptidase family protein [Flavobacteriales bacterium]